MVTDKELAEACQIVYDHFITELQHDCVYGSELDVVVREANKPKYPDGMYTVKSLNLLGKENSLYLHREQGKWYHANGLESGIKDEDIIKVEPIIADDEVAIKKENVPDSYMINVILEALRAEGRRGTLRDVRAWADTLGIEITDDIWL